MDRFENINLSEPFLLKKKYLQKEVENIDIIKSVRIAVLSDSTVNNLIDYIDIFLRTKGIVCSFWIGDFNKIYDDAVFRINEILNFNPTIILIHETNRSLISKDFEKWCISYEKIWDSLKQCKCNIIQTNLPLPLYRPLQNGECCNNGGNVNSTLRVNLWMADRIQATPYLHLLDLNYISSKIGLDNWYDERMWYMYGCSYSQKIVPMVSYHVSKLILSLLGFNHKLIILDLDNTLWGGVWADDGPDGVRLGGETAEGRAYNQFQKYILELKNSGILLAICSKNSIEAIRDCFDHPGSVLSWQDFACTKINWHSKVDNIKDIIREMNIGFDSVIFLDDNPVERMQIESELSMVWAPRLDRVENYISILENGLIFDKKIITEEDKNRTHYYQQNTKREQAKQNTVDRKLYLKQLKMKLSIVSPGNNIERIVQLINKTNQFQVTGRRGSESDLQQYSQDNVIVAAKLSDIFGDNGIISVIGISFHNKIAIIDYWVMSCRVFQRDVEYALFNYVVNKYVCGKAEIIQLTYVPTPKNQKITEVLGTLGFSIKEQRMDSFIYEIKVSDYSNSRKIDYIEVSNG